MDIEDLDLNPFFHALRTDHRDIWDAAALNSWLLCIPQASSLRGGTKRIDIETHVLQPSRSFPGEFLTLTGNVVTVVGSEIHTKSGFNESRRVKILYTEEFNETNDDDTTTNTSSNTSSNTRNQASTSSQSNTTERVFSIIHIGRPLIGGVNAPSSADEMNRSIIVKYMAMLRSFPEHEPIMLRLDDFVRRTNEYLRTNELPSGGQLEKLLTRELDHAVGTLMNSSCFVDSTARSSNVNKRKTKMQLSQVIESYLLEGIHARVFSRLSNEHRHDDEELTRILDGMVLWTQSDLKMRPEFQCPLNDAIDTMSLLTLSCVTPLEKLLCLKKVHDQINRAVERNLTSRYLDIGAHQMTTDDLLDQLIYAIVCARKKEIRIAKSILSQMKGKEISQIQANISNSTSRVDLLKNMRCISLKRSFLSTNVQYMQRFHLINLNTTVLGYNLANLEVAIGWFILKRTRIRGPLWNVKKRNYYNKNRLEHLKRIQRNTNNTTETNESVMTEGGSGSSGSSLILIGEGGETSFHVGRRSSPTPTETAAATTSTTSSTNASTITQRRRRSTTTNDIIIDVACSSHNFCKIDGNGKVWTWGAGNMSSSSSSSSSPLPSPTAAMSVLLRNSSTPISTTSTPSNTSSSTPSTPSTSSTSSTPSTPSPSHSVSSTLSSSNATTPSSDILRRSLFVRCVSSLPLSSLRNNIRVVQVACGMHHVLVRDEAGGVHAWGDHKSGQLGLGELSSSSSSSEILIPTQVQLFSHTDEQEEENVYDKYGYSIHEKRNNKKEKTNNNNSTNRSGSRASNENNATSKNKNQNKDGITVGIPCGSRYKAKHVACGSAHSMCVTTTGQVLIWGRGKSGRLGLGKSTRDRYLPVLLTPIEDNNSSNDDSEYGNQGNQDGNQDVNQEENRRRRNSSRSSSRSRSRSSRNSRNTGWGQSGECVWMDGGWSHSLAVTRCGRAYSWGCGADGRLGVGCYSDQLSPTLVRLYDDEYNHSISNSSMNGSSNTNDDVDVSVSSPLRRAAPSTRGMHEEEDDLAYCLTEIEPCMDNDDDPIVRAAAGYAHSTFLTHSGILYTTGCGVSGQLARFDVMETNEKNEKHKDDEENKEEKNKETDHGFIPTVVSLVPRPMRWNNQIKKKNEKEVALSDEKNEEDEKKYRIVDVACGDHHTVVITETGNVWAWGLNQAGQCTPLNKTTETTNENATSKSVNVSDEQLWPQLLVHSAKYVKCGPNTTAVSVISLEN